MSITIHKLTIPWLSLYQAYPFRRWHWYAIESIHNDHRQCLTLRLRRMIVHYFSFTIYHINSYSSSFSDPRTLRRHQLQKKVGSGGSKSRSWIYNNFRRLITTYRSRTEHRQDFWIRTSRSHDHCLPRHSRKSCRSPFTYFFPPMYILSHSLTIADRTSVV